MIQKIAGRDVYVVVLTESPSSIHPVNDGGNPELKPYADALNAAILDGVVIGPGKYGIEVNTYTDTWSIYAVNEWS